MNGVRVALTYEAKGINGLIVTEQEIHLQLLAWTQRPHMRYKRIVMKQIKQSVQQKRQPLLQ